MYCNKKETKNTTRSTNNYSTNRRISWNLYL